MEIISIFAVTNYKTRAQEQVSVEGAGEETIKVLRAAYPKFSRIVLKGFNINGKFKRARI